MIRDTTMTHEFRLESPLWQKTQCLHWSDPSWIACVKNRFSYLFKKERPARPHGCDSDH